MPLDRAGINLLFGVRLHLYNAPAFCACFLNAICVVSVKFFFREHYAGVVNKDPVS